MNIRVLQWFLVAVCIASAAAAFVGGQSVLDRLWSVAAVVICGLGAWGIHRRSRFVWPLGWVVLIVSAIWFVIEAAIMLVPQPYGWVGVIGVVVGAGLVIAYWGIWWHRHREYFSPDGISPAWRPDLSPLRWFGIGMFALALIFILAALLASAFHK